MNELPLLPLAALKGAVVLLLAFTGVRLLRRTTSAVRHGVLFVALTSLTGIAVAPFVLPRWSIPLWYSEASSATASPAAPAVAETEPAAQDPHEPGLGTTSRPSDESRRAAAIARAVGVVRLARLRVALLALWIGGALLTFLPWCVGRIAVARRLRDGRPAPDAWRALVHEIARELDLSIVPDVVLVDRPVGPMTIGWSEPRLLLPASAAEWTRERLRAVLLHELAHVKRRDDLTHSIARLGCVVHWFNPLAWLALKRLRCEREFACDDLVIRNGLAPADYAATLLELARSLRATSRVAGFAGFSGLAGMAEPSTIERRIHAALDGDRRRDPIRPRIARIGASGAALVLIGFACATPTSAARPVATDPTTDLVFDSASELRARIAAARGKALRDLHHLHFVVSGQEWDWNANTQSWDKSQARWHARAWYEGGPDDRFRVDYDPRICRWFGGPTPFGENRYSVAWDGELYRKLDHVYWDGWYKSQLTESRPECPTFVDFEGIQGRARQARSFSLFGFKIPLGSTDGSLFPHSEVGHFINHLHITDQMAFDISTDAQGMATVEIRFRGRPVNRFVLDPDKNYATVSELRFERGGEIGFSWQSTNWKQMSPDLWLPTAWDQQSLRLHRNTVVLDVAGYFSPLNADAIFSMQDVDTTRRSHDAPAGPDFRDVAGPP